MSHRSSELTGPPKKHDEGEGLWILSFSDMVLILMCFFLLMMSSMSPNKQRFEDIQDAATKDGAERKGSLKDIEKKVKRVIKAENLSEEASVEQTSQGLHIEFKNALVFDSGSSMMKPATIETVKILLKTIAQIGDNYHVVIEGHTDDSPVKGNLNYPSNWELSAARGFTLMRELYKMGVPETKVSVTAYAHTRPKVPYKGLRGKELVLARNANRRVVVFIE